MATTRFRALMNVAFLSTQHAKRRPFVLTSRLQHSGTLIENTALNSNDEESGDETEKLRDISRLPFGLRDRLEHARKPPPRVYRNHSERHYLRKLYAWHGESSGVDPAISWPTMEELQETMEDEAEFEPTLQELMFRVNEKKRIEEEERRQKEQHVGAQMEKMPKYIESFKKRIEKLEAEERKADQKRLSLLDEARDFFGYNIDPRDPRFVQMQEMKAEEDLKEKKRKKKEAKKLRDLSGIKPS